MTAWLDAARQGQFLDVVTRDEAEARFRRHLRMVPLGMEQVPLDGARGRWQCGRNDVRSVRPLRQPELVTGPQDRYAPEAHDDGVGEQQSGPHQVDRTSTRRTMCGLMPTR